MVSDGCVRHWYHLGGEEGAITVTRLDAVNIVSNGLRHGSTVYRADRGDVNVEASNGETSCWLEPLAEKQHTEDKSSIPPNLPAKPPRIASMTRRPTRLPSPDLQVAGYRPLIGCGRRPATWPPARVWTAGREVQKPVSAHPSDGGTSRARAPRSPTVRGKRRQRRQ